MSLKENPTTTKRIPAQTIADTVTPRPAITPTAGYLLGATRIVLGFVFTWAFADKLFGLGYATPDKTAWINGGAPTKGFLGGVNAGPFQSMFNNWSGAAWADWLFMLGLAGVGLALITGIALRIAAASGSLMMLLMWTAEWPLAQHTTTGELTHSTNPLIDYHIIYTLLLLTLAALYAGRYLGLGNRWEQLNIVHDNRWLI